MPESLIQVFCRVDCYIVLNNVDNTQWHAEC